MAVLLCVPRRVDVVFNISTIPPRSFRVVSTILLCRWQKFRQIPGLLIQEVDYYVTRYVAGAARFPLQLQIVAVLVKKTRRLATFIDPY